MAKKKSDGQILHDALVKSYTARALLFHEKVEASGIDLLIAEVEAIDGSKLRWDAGLGVTNSASQRVNEMNLAPQLVFAHPEVIVTRPHLISYYRNLAALPQKGMNQLLFSTIGWESRRSSNIDASKAREICVALNAIISGVIDETENYTLDLGRRVALAEIGTEIQGTWANVIGRGAAKAVEQIIAHHLDSKAIGQRASDGSYELNNGWRIVVASEPDIAFYDADGTVRVAIEIKGSLDKAGAQTRYGEAKKSFAKAIGANPRCHTIYLASCFTDAVMEQIKADGEVREYFNLTSIVYDEDERERFIARLFHQVNIPE